MRDTSGSSPWTMRAGRWTRSRSRRSWRSWSRRSTRAAKPSGAPCSKCSSPRRGAAARRSTSKTRRDAAPRGRSRDEVRTAPAPSLTDHGNERPGDPQKIPTVEPETMPASEPVSTSVPVDDPSARLLARLRSTGTARHDGVAELHALLLRAARFELRRRAQMLASCGTAELDELAHECADEAVTAVLAKLDSFRGESRVTTWADKFALLEASVRAPRRGWGGPGGPDQPPKRE